jgi:peptidoglycan/xylan/chitin deacetylase (PgdA/CDA1 family)
MLLVANYHYIRTDFTAKYPSIFGLTPKQFKNQLLELSKHGTFISQNELLQFLNKPFDKNYILITFDDGLSEQFKLAKPILDELGIPFIFFINEENYTDTKVSLVHKIHMTRSKVSSDEIIEFIQKNNEIVFTDKQQQLAEINYNYDDAKTAKLKYMLNFSLTVKEQEKIITPIFNELFNEKKIASTLYFSNEELDVLFHENSIGSHGYKHIPFGLYEKEEINDYFSKSQRFFTERYGIKCKSISYPYGAYEACRNTIEIARKNDFQLGFSMERASNSNLNNPLMLSRFDCNDLPAGKQNLFKGENIFVDSHKSSWYR